MGVRNHTATHAPPPEKRIFGSGIFDTYLEKSDMAQWSQKANVTGNSGLDNLSKMP